MNLPDNNGQTILFHAVINGDLEFVSFLCNQKQFLNVALRDVNGKSVFDYIKLIKEPAKRDVLHVLIYNKSKETGWLYELASYNYLKDV
jgi:ankyrin repeat protein